MIVIGGGSLQVHYIIHTAKQAASIQCIIPHTITQRSRHQRHCIGMIWYCCSIGICLCRCCRSRNCRRRECCDILHSLLLLLRFHHLRFIEIGIIIDIVFVIIDILKCITSRGTASRIHRRRRSRRQCHCGGTNSPSPT